MTQYVLAFLLNDTAQVMCLVEPHKIIEWTRIANYFTTRLRDVVGGKAERSAYTNNCPLWELDPNISLYSGENYPQIKIMSYTDGKVMYKDKVYESLCTWTTYTLEQFCMGKYDACELSLGLSHIPITM